MWTDGWLDWVVLLSGYVLALTIFRFLGGFAAAGDAFRTWGKAYSARKTKLSSSSSSS